jgi:hypothetical protein
MKFVGISAFAIALTIGGTAQAQTVLSRHVDQKPVETVVTRQANGTVTTTQRVMPMTTRSASMPMSHAVAKKPAQKIVYRTIVKREIVQAPQPQAIVVREPVTRWVPGILPPFTYPVTTYEDRIVYTMPVTTPTYTTITRPAFQSVVDDDEAPLVRAYGPAYTTPAGYVVRY